MLVIGVSFVCTSGCPWAVRTCLFRLTNSQNRSLRTPLPIAASQLLSSMKYTENPWKIPVWEKICEIKQCSYRTESAGLLFYK